MVEALKKIFGIEKKSEFEGMSPEQIKAHKIRIAGMGNGKPPKYLPAYGW